MHGADWLCGQPIEMQHHTPGGGKSRCEAETHTHLVRILFEQADVSSIHDSEDDLVVTCRGGFIIIVLAYKELLEEKMTSEGPIGSLLEEPRVHCIQTNLNSMVLHVDQEYALLHSVRVAPVNY